MSRAKITLSIAFILTVVSVGFVALLFTDTKQESKQEPSLGAPYLGYTQSLLPDSDSSRYIGTTSPSTVAYKGIITDGLLITSLLNKSCLGTDGSGNLQTGTCSGSSGDPNVIISNNYFRASTTGLSWLFSDGFVSQASSTIDGSLTVTGNATTTNATTTSLYVSGVASTSALYLGTGTGCLSASAAGLVSASGSSCAATSNPNLIVDSNGFFEASTTGRSWLFTNGFVSQASSTFSGGAGKATTTFVQGIKVIADGSVSNSTSVGGIVNITNTNNDGAGLVIYTANGSSATGRPLVVRVNNTAFPTQAVDIESTSDVASALNVLAAPSGLGAIKVGANAVGDANGSMLSLDASLASYIGQAFFAKCSSASGFCFSTVDSGSNSIFRLDNGGHFGISQGTPTEALHVGSVFLLSTTTASSTLMGKLTITGNSTTTNATTTALYSTTASSTNLFSTLFYGGSLQTCNSGNFLTWASGSFGCSADQTGVGGSFPFTTNTNYGVTVNATDTPIWFTQGIQASSTSHFSGIDNFNWVLSTSTTVCAYQCQYSSIQNALSAGYKNITLKAETYTGPVSITASDTTIRGAGMYSSLITCDGATDGLCVSIATSSNLTRVTLEDFGIDNTNASHVGTGLDTSDTSNVYTDHIRITDFDLAHLHQDTTNTAYYSSFNNMVYFDVNNCFRATGTLPNDNAHYMPRCRVDTATGIGYDFIDVEGWTLYSPNSEPATQIGTAFRVDGTSIGIHVISPWFENNATGTEIQSGALNTSITGGGRITGNVLGFWNRGSHTILNGPLVSSNTRNFDDADATGGIYLTSDNDYSTSWMGIGTSTQQSTDTRLTVSGSFATALEPMMWINQNGAFASGYAGIGFGMQAPGSPFGSTGLAKIGCIPGSGFAATNCTWYTADSTGVSTLRLTIDETGVITIPQGIVGQASSTIDRLTTRNATSTYATSTNLAVTGIASTTTLYLGTGTGCLSAAANGLVSASGVACGSGSGSSNSKWATSTIDNLAISPNSALRVGIGTTTPRWAVQIASSTGSQLTLSDPSSLTNNHWSFRNAGGVFYLATSSASTFATSTTAALSIGVNGNVTLGNGLIVSGQATTTNLLVLASSTFQNFTGVNATTSKATTTSLYVSGVASTSALYLATGTGCLSASSAGLVSASGSSCLTTSSIQQAKWATSSADSLAISTAGALRVGIGTTTPRWALQVASSTGPQLTLSDSSSISNVHWSFRNAGGNLYLATSSPSTFATTSTAALTLFNTGQPSLGIATSSFTGQLGIGSTTNSLASTTIGMGKIQFDGYSPDGTRYCVFIADGGTWTVLSGACTP